MNEIEKLVALKDIEEELGIDLLTLFKAFKYGIWSKGSWSISDFSDGCLENEPHFIEPIFLELGFISGDLCLYTLICGKVVYAVKIKDYGKTWRLIEENELGERTHDVG